MKIIIDPNKLLYVEPYLVNGHKQAMVPRKHFVNQAGVYLIRENGILVYIGMSKSSIYYTMYRHFQNWNDGRGISRTIYDPTAHRYEVSIITTSADYASVLERELIRQHTPRDNKCKYDSIINEKLLAEFFAEVAEVEVPF
jgi:hypothetical protein